MAPMNQKEIELYHAVVDRNIEKIGTLSTNKVNPNKLNLDTYKLEDSSVYLISYC